MGNYHGKAGFDTFSHHRSVAQTPLRFVCRSLSAPRRPLRPDQRTAWMNPLPGAGRNGASPLWFEHASALSSTFPRRPGPRPALPPARHGGQRACGETGRNPLPDCPTLRRSTSRLMQLNSIKSADLIQTGNQACACRDTGPRQRSVWTGTYRVKPVKPSRRSPNAVASPYAA